MGYFSNGTEGDMYEEKWCNRCIHQSQGCAVWHAHMVWNYDQCKDPKVHEILNIFIPQMDDGLGNKKCTMFKRTLKDKPDPDDGEPMLFEKHEIGGAPVEVKETA